MIDAAGNRICDKEIWSRKQGLWCGCRRTATINVPSQYICAGLDFCDRHTASRINPDYTQPSIGG